MKQKLALWLFYRPLEFWKKNWWHKTLIVTLLLGLSVIGGMYWIARSYISSQQNKPLVMGVSFIPAYAESLGLDAKKTMDALINDVGVRHFRLVSYWDQLEPRQDEYDFSLLDWQFKKAEAVNAKVTLSLGLRQPRWPECHPPSWIKDMDSAQWHGELLDFINATVERYKDSPSLDSYQLENEYFLMGFGECTDFSRERLIKEAALVKSLDPKHKLIIARSNNALGFPLGQPQPDEFGISIYKRVWDANLTKRYLEYPFPAWYYAFVAGTQQMITGKNMMIHELQAETWPPNWQSIQNTSLEEQNKSFNAERFKSRVEFGKATGMREIYLWGAEYWYYRDQKLNDSSLWDVAKETFKK